jgi:maltose alpha-D-glucosyltransferase/alpha-amylase
VLRYGDEIGMGDDLSLKERESVRTPMQWSTEPQAGFTTSNKPHRPIIDKGVWSYERINVEKQRYDSQSLLNWTVQMIRLRKECPEVGWGSWRILGTRSNHVLGIMHEWRNNYLVTLHNFSDKAVDAMIDVEVEGGERLVNLIANDHSDAVKGKHHRIVLEPHGYRWYRVGGLDYILRREKY